MNAPRFDKSRHHGTIHPPYHGAMLVQNGCYFSGSGEYLFREGETPGQARSGAQRSAGAAKAPVAPPAPQNAPTAPESSKEEDNTSIDLAAWARGDVKLPFFKVRNAVAEAHPDIDTGVGVNKKAIIAALKERGVI